MPKLTKSQLALRRTYPKKKRVPVIATLKKQVRHLMAVDRNQIYTDDHSANAVPTTAGLVTYLNPNLVTYVYGAANAASTQATLLVKHLRLSMDLTVQSNSTLRVIIFKDTANEGVLPSVQQVISDNAGTTTILSGRTIDFISRIKVLYDKTHHFLTSTDNAAAGAIGPCRANRVITINKSFKDLKMRFNGTAASTVADANKNQLFMLQIVSNTNFAAGSFISRMTFEPPKASQ